MNLIRLIRPGTIFRDFRGLFLLALALTLAFIATYHQAILTCDVCDATTYRQMAETYAGRGIVATTGSELRLYGYPLFLSFIVRLSRLTGFAFAPLVAGIQFGLYLGAILWLAGRLKKHVSPQAGLLVGVALLTDIFVLPYLAAVVTDGVSLTLQIVLAGVLLEVYGQPPAPRRLLCLGALLGGLWAFAIMIRPANLLFGGFIAAGIGLLPLLRAEWRTRLCVLLPLAAVACFAVVVLPQVLLNWRAYHVASILPAMRLGDYQLVAGRRLLKCATIMLNGDGHGQGIAYLNPWHGGDGLGLGWYLANPRFGMKTALAHVFASVDFDYYRGIVTTMRSPVRLPLFLASHTIVYWSMWGWWRGIGRWRQDAPAAARLWLFGLATSAALVAGWLAIYALAAAENRFALPLFAVGLPWALWSLTTPQPPRRQMAGWAGFALYLALAWHVTNSLDLTKVIVQ
jgi:hypothetical protein